VRDSISTQTPLLVRYPNSPAAQDVEALAQRLIELGEPESDPGAKLTT
jgi:MinD-like ATPase involved in chromosome partitioning or flagellar assembly